MITVLGLGQPLRGDDSLGWQVLQSLAEREGLRKVWVGDDATRILDALEGCEKLILVDALRTGSPWGTIHRIDLTAPVGKESLSFSSHSLNPLSVLELAAKLGRPLPRVLLLFGIEGRDFRLGQGLSEPVARSLKAVIDAISSAL